MIGRQSTFRGGGKSADTWVSKGLLYMHGRYPTSTETPRLLRYALAMATVGVCVDAPAVVDTDGAIGDGRCGAVAGRPSPSAESPPVPGNLLLAPALSHICRDKRRDASNALVQSQTRLQPHLDRHCRSTMTHPIDPVNLTPVPPLRYSYVYHSAPYIESDPSTGASGSRARPNVDDQDGDGDAHGWVMGIDEAGRGRESCSALC
jgi:hypothetical protein